ncbi:hypothetical protein AUR64_10895 [Haloprofundus marisrubri]|uniref:Uncharacterized protein n=1 Tax=Haloprofundus marisrubri TaxID=1514971 RepID=A0A0W1RAF5_9EURY|nr:hypothetical protein [Haloprofundus marisrubri]KTG10095.1 hypothetical protein AUR64_10895 [Haloprofundus marisrubri]
MNTPTEPLPTTTESVVQTFVFLLVAFAAMVVASYPTATLTALASVGVLTLATIGALAARRSLGHRSHICIPHTGVCIDA